MNQESAVVVVGRFLIWALLLGGPAFSDEHSDERIKKLIGDRQVVLKEFCREPDVQLRGQLLAKLQEMGRLLDRAIQTHQKRVAQDKGLEVPLQGEGSPTQDNGNEPVDREALLQKVRTQIVEHFRDRFLPSEAFRSAFGPHQWSQVGDEVREDAKAFGAGDDREVFEEEDSITFMGRIWDLHTEVTVSRSGTVRDIYFEID